MGTLLILGAIVLLLQYIITAPDEDNTDDKDPPMPTS
jgi:hypothetical protein